jgi:protein O-mannosyl-transferase
MYLGNVIKKNALIQSSFWVIIVVAPFLTLWPTLTGPFLFDDYSNLNALREVGGNLTLEGVKNYITDKSAGPTGRPLSMLSFLINDVYWPSNAESFKYTNILIHILNGLALTWLILMIARRHFVELDARLKVAAILLAGFWVLNPYHLSSIAYVIQRMALLSAFCVLVGLIVFIKGRVFLEKGKKKTGYTLIWTGYVVGAGIGALFKENAAVFFFLAPLMEHLLFGKASKEKKPFLLTLTFLVPILALVFFLASYILWQHAYIWYRDFTLTERLLSQSRTMGYYLWRYIVPGVGYSGIYTDGFEKSTDLFQPASTFFWFLAHFAIVLIAFLFRKRWPLFFLGICFFYIAHSIESSVIPLELFFEHRNYLPSALLLLGLLHASRIKYFVPTAIAIVMLTASLQYLRSTFWSNEQQLKSIMVVENPRSERALITYASYLEKSGEASHALKLLRNFMANEDYGFDIALNSIKLACALKSDNEADVSSLLESLEKYRGKASAMTDQVKSISDQIRKDWCQTLTFEDLYRFLDLYMAAYPRDGEATQAQYVARGYVAFYSGEDEQLKYNILKALEVRKNPRLAYSGCSQLLILSRKDACLCFTNHKKYITDEPPTAKNMMQKIFGEHGDLTTSYNQRMKDVCADHDA